MKVNERKKFPANRIEEILVDTTISLSKKESQNRMLDEYKYYRGKGFKVDHHNLYDQKRIIMKRGDESAEVKE